MANIGPEPLVVSVVDALEVATVGADAANDPRAVGNGVADVAAVDVDGIAVPSAVRIGDAVVGDPDGHILVTTHGVNNPSTSRRLRCLK